MREGLRDGYGPALGLRGGVALRLQDERDDAADHEHDHQRHLEDEHLPGDAARALADEGAPRDMPESAKKVRHAIFLAPAFPGGYGWSKRWTNPVPTAVYT
ncbi:hypothetical protein Scel_06700 [Streptomyces cellostaticus]|nr:hypothetical protein Scel_06700 [Streptomyces cellostaticus]